MKKINLKTLNLALWIEIVLAYILPFWVIDDFQYKVGFPIPFLSFHHKAMSVTPLMSMNLDFLRFLLNGAIIYWVLSFAIKAYQKFKDRNEK